MSTMFSSVEQAKAMVAAVAGVDLNSFEEVPDLKVAGMDSVLLDDPNTSEEIKESIRNRLKAQRGFKFMKDGKEMRIVIGPFRNGYDCWILIKDGFAHRI